MVTIRFPDFLVNLKVLKQLVIIPALLLLTACVKDTKIEPEPETEPSLVVSFKAMVNNQQLVPTTGNYTNTSGDAFSVTKFNYMVSNVILTSTEGKTFVEPESYHLIKHVGGSNTFTINNLPKGSYSKIEFVLGVDSIRNISGAQTGALDTGNDMYWDWNTGYIFFKLEGEYTSNNTPDKSGYSIHIGGFAGPYKCLQNCSLSLAQPIEARANKQSKLYCLTNVDEIFVKPTTLGFDYYYENVNEKTFRQISINYKDMISVEKVEN